VESEFAFNTSQMKGIKVESDMTILLVAEQPRVEVRRSKQIRNENKRVRMYIQYTTGIKENSLTVRMYIQYQDKKKTLSAWALSRGRVRAKPYNVAE
jgi:hypothetical protein